MVVQQLGLSTNWRHYFEFRPLGLTGCLFSTGDAPRLTNAIWSSQVKISQVIIRINKTSEFILYSYSMIFNVIHVIHISMSFQGHKGPNQTQYGHLGSSRNVLVASTKRYTMVYLEFTRTFSQNDLEWFRSCSMNVAPSVQNGRILELWLIWLSTQAFLYNLYYASICNIMRVCKILKTPQVYYHLGINQSHANMCWYDVHQIRIIALHQCVLTSHWRDSLAQNP